MKAQELRIGNLVLVKDGTATVESIHEEGINAYDEPSYGGGSTMEYGALFEGHPTHDYIIEPIPLTEEWLRKFGFEDGFEKNELSAPYTQEPDEQIYIGWNTARQTWVFLIHTDEGRKCITKSFQYIHQLQNIWFALTGEELKHETTL